MVVAFDVEGWAKMKERDYQLLLEALRNGEKPPDYPLDHDQLIRALIELADQNILEKYKNQLTEFELAYIQDRTKASLITLDV